MLVVAIVQKMLKLRGKVIRIFPNNYILCLPPSQMFMQCLVEYARQNVGSIICFFGVHFMYTTAFAIL